MKLIIFLALFFGSVLMGIIGWVILGGILHFYDPSFTIQLNLFNGFWTGVGAGIINGLCYVVKLYE